MPRIESVKVGNPKIHTSTPLLRSFASYQISSRILYDVDGEECAKEGLIVVRRRFKEFQLLQTCLRSNNPGYILPPLPPATLHRNSYPLLTFNLALVQPSEELIAARQVQLQRYLNNVLSNTQLRDDPAFWLFVESENFVQLVNEFQLHKESAEIADISQRSHSATHNHFLSSGTAAPKNDPLEDRLEYFMGIAHRLEALKMNLAELYRAQQIVADEVDGVAKSLTGCLEASLDGGEQNEDLITIIQTVGNIGQMIGTGVESENDINGFLVVLDDFLRGMGEIEATFTLKRTLQAIIHAQEMQLIDIQASLILTQAEQERNFDQNYDLSKNYLNMRDEMKKNMEIFSNLCRTIHRELDRLEVERMTQIESGINTFIQKMINVHREVLASLEGISESVSSEKYVLSPPPITAISSLML